MKSYTKIAKASPMILFSSVMTMLFWLLDITLSPALMWQRRALSSNPPWKTRRARSVVAAQIAERRFAQRVVTRQQFLDPARHETRHRRHCRDRMALRQKPDRLKVPRRAHILAGSITRRQIFNAQVVLDMGHGSPPRFMAPQSNCFA